MPEHVDVGRLQEQQDRLHVGRRRPARVLIDDDFPGLGRSRRRHGEDASENNCAVAQRMHFISHLPTGAPPTWPDASIGTPIARRRVAVSRRT